MIKKVLVVDDSGELDSQIKALNAQLNGSYSFRLVKSGELKRKKVELNPDFILADASAIDIEEIKSLFPLKERRLSTDIPLILLTGDPEKDKLTKLFDVGITEFLLKPLNVNELVYRLQLISIRNQNLSKVYREEKQIRKVTVVAKSTTNVIVVLYPDGTVEWVNDGFEKLYGYPFEEYLERFGHYIFSRDSKAFLLALNKFRKGEKGLTLEHQIKTESTDSKWIQATLTPIFDEAGNLTKIVVLETDITRRRLERRRTEELLSNILPFEIAEQLKRKGKVKSKRYKQVSVLFADFKDFTGLTKTMSADELISELNSYVHRFDEIIEMHYIEKIKTIGDAYMCAGGLPLKNLSNPIDVTLAGLEIQKFVNDMAREKREKGEPPWELRMGIHTGEVMAGVIGSKRFAYDIWGNTVNIASRMEETGLIGKVNVSGTTYSYIRDYFEFTYRGKVRMKNMPDEVDMYFVNRLKPEYAEDKEGFYPNARFRKIRSRY